MFSSSFLRDPRKAENKKRSVWTRDDLCTSASHMFSSGHKKLQMISSLHFLCFFCACRSLQIYRTQMRLERIRLSSLPAIYVMKQSNILSIRFIFSFSSLLIFRRETNYSEIYAFHYCLTVPSCTHVERHDPWASDRRFWHSKKQRRQYRSFAHQLKFDEMSNSTRLRIYCCDRRNNVRFVFVFVSNYERITTRDAQFSDDCSIHCEVCRAQFRRKWINEKFEYGFPFLCYFNKKL